MAPILTRTPLASYTFVDTTGKKNIRVVYQDQEGNVKQAFFRQGDGWHKRSNNHVGTADLNSGFAITGWNNGTEERVYYIGKDGYIVERYYSGGAAGEWYDGELNGKFKAAPYSQLAVTVILDNDTIWIRLYYQSVDGTIQELVRNNSDPWTTGASFPGAIKGTSIAATTLKAKPYHIWLWFQKEDTTITEQLYQAKGPWKTGIFKSQFIYNPGAYIAGSSYGKDSHSVFTVTKDNRLAVTQFNGPANSWEPSKVIANQIPFSSLAAVAVAGEGEPEPAVRVYGQKNASQITEWGTYDGKEYKETVDALPIDS